MSCTTLLSSNIAARTNTNSAGRRRCAWKYEPTSGLAIEVVPWRTPPTKQTIGPSTRARSAAGSFPRSRSPPPRARRRGRSVRLGPIVLRHQRAPVHGVKALACVVTTPDLREIASIDAHDVRGVIEPRAVDERGADAVHVDRHAKLLEVLDLSCVETARRDDAHVAVSGVVERATQHSNQTWCDTAHFLVARPALAFPQEVEHRFVDE